MILANYHTHCTFSDGKHDPETLVRTALGRSFAALGFSTHAPVHFDNHWAMKPGREAEYAQVIDAIRDEYRGRIEVYLGMEIDYFEGLPRWSHPDVKLDFTIGSVHFVVSPVTGKPVPVDSDPREFEQVVADDFGGDVRAMVTAYYSSVAAMVRRDRPDIVGHFDLVKKFNKAGRYFIEGQAWYAEAMRPALEAVAECRPIVEINTSILHRKLGDEAYPSLAVLKRLREAGIPVLLGSDSHTADSLGACFAEAAASARTAGYCTQRMLLHNEWTDVAL